MPSIKKNLQMQRFALRLQEALDKRNLTPAQLAGKLDVDPSTVHRWLKEGQIPQPRTVAAVAALLVVSRDWLIGVEGAMPAMPSVMEGEPAFSYLTSEGSRAALEYFLEAMPLPQLIDRLAEILNDESQSAEKRLALARSILPTIERRKTELESASGK